MYTYKIHLYIYIYIYICHACIGIGTSLDPNIKSPEASDRARGVDGPAGACKDGKAWEALGGSSGNLGDDFS